MGVSGRCEFVMAPADDLSALPDASADVVTTRSVLVYVADKRRAFSEFFRVLRPGGRLSIWEPINRFTYPEPPDRFEGYDVGPVRDLAEKVKAVFERIQPYDADPMLDFDERDLLALAEGAELARVRLDYRAEVAEGGLFPDEGRDWDGFVGTSGNPKIPTVGEAMEQALAPQERERFEGHLRPLVEEARREERRAGAYLLASRG